MVDEKYDDSTLEQLRAVESYFVPEVANRLKKAGLTDINNVDQFVGWLFTVESLAELGLKKDVLDTLSEAGVESVGDLLLVMTRKKDRPRFIR